MKIILCILLVIICIFLLILIIGLILPKERIATSEAFYNSSPEKVYSIVINNNDFHYRSDLQNLNIIEQNGEFEIWDEISKSGDVIRFNTALKEPYSRYEMRMKSKLFTGYWIGEFHKTPDGGTHFITTEKIKIMNPLFRFMNYVFFDLHKFMDTYKEDVRKKLNE